VSAAPSLHLRPRGEGGEQRITAVELLFDLVFVFAITALSHLVLDDLSVKGLLRAGFLLIVVWWAWINTTWLANWLEPGSTRVRLVLVGGALAALLLAAALPRAFEQRLPHATFEYVPNAGHVPFWDAPDSIARAVRATAARATESPDR